MTTGADVDRAGSGWRRRASSLFARGEPMVWLTGGAMAISLAMILGLLGLVLANGLPAFWPQEVVRLETVDGRVYMGEQSKSDSFAPGDEVFDRLPEEFRAGARARVAARDGSAVRRMFRTGNYELTGTHFHWVSDYEIAKESKPEWSLVLERLTWGRFYGEPIRFLVDGEVVAEGPEDTWGAFGAHHPDARRRWHEQRRLETDAVGERNHDLEQARLRLRQCEIDHGRDSVEWKQESERYGDAKRLTDAELRGIRDEIEGLRKENARYQMVLRTASGREAPIPIADIVRAYPANRVSWFGKVGIYVSRWWEYLTDDPREANSEGGVWPAVFGTVVMTLIMTLVVVPFGVLAALYLREYAKQGLLVSIVRIAVNNLAGVPSIVFGVFGLGFFCYVVGVSIDELFFTARLPNPTYGKGGILWAALTLALLTLPVVIVATEEALSAVPRSMREGSYACGASKWQTIRRIVLPRATPGIMTGTILAIARGAGEVAPLMLVGAVKLAPELPMDGTFPYVHPERSFMHLGFHIYDLGFQSQNSEAARPMVYTTTLLLIGIVAALNLFAMVMRSRVRRQLKDSHF